MRDLNCSLNDIDNTDVGSLFGVLGYLERSSKKKGESDILTIGKKKYKKVSADNAAWL